jgi:Domain of unknown function (DUF1906)
MRGRHRARAVRPLLALALVLMCSVFGLQTLVQSAPHASAGSYTPAGNWWGVDSVDPLNAADLAAVRNWYQGGTPQVWGRYISDIGGALTKTEMNFASQNGIYLYLLVADRNNSSPLVCGRDLNATDAVADAQTAVAAANALGIKPGAVLFKDFEQTQCPGEPSAAYVQSWYQTVAATSYRVGFYGNSFSQTNQFPQAFCAAVGAVPGLISQVTLSASEPEPNFNSAIGTTGPASAPAWAADTPSCAPAATTTVWQYGEVGSQVGNIADIDEVRPGTPGLVAPDGSITRSASGSVPDRNLVSDGGFNGSAVGWHNSPSTNYVVYPSGSAGTTAFEGSGYLATNSSIGSGGVYQDIPASVSPGQTFCASMELTTGDGSVGATGALVLWLTGGLSNESSMRVASNLPGGSVWTREQTCVMATTAHTAIRVQLYPAAGGPTIALDDVSVTPDRAVNGGFNSPGGTWTQTTNSNSFRFQGQGGAVAYEGAGFMAVNASASNGSVFEDVPTNIIPGDTFCASAELTSADATGAGGALVVWLLGVNAPEASLHVTNNLSGNGAWTTSQACVQATAAHSVIRVQFYPNAGGPTVGIDAVSLL